MSWPSRDRKPAPSEPSNTNGPQPDVAWRVLLVTNDWIRHADSKTAVTLAFITATGVMLFNLVHDLGIWKCTTIALTLGTILALVGAMVFSASALAPRTKASKDSPPNPLFFGAIASMDKASYLKTLSTLTSTPEELVLKTADQVHENSVIANKKHQRVKIAIRFEVAAAVSVALLGLCQSFGV